VGGDGYGILILPLSILDLNDVLHVLFHHDVQKKISLEPSNEKKNAENAPMERDC